ncbi:MAG: hypothetical protein GY866_40690 [Proteobacteria bacterium]|nr:hypothetical protein [Pseudomonadota bacterium]
MKQIILAFFATFILIGTAYSQCPERQPVRPQSSQRSADEAQICLESFEMCNNWARHYCRSGYHERVVNSILQRMKERGMTITTARIKSIARRTHKSNPTPSQPVE